ncbi:MAG: hypothetical protein IPI35_34860 [Deltaproteobacteria bacterium]|nr:hypothetical protein [Deltaproteobacteria bacterium]
MTTEAAWGVGAKRPRGEADHRAHERPDGPPLDRAFAFSGASSAPSAPGPCSAWDCCSLEASAGAPPGLRSDLSFIGIPRRGRPGDARLAEVTAKFGAASSVFVVITGGRGRAPGGG